MWNFQLFHVGGVPLKIRAEYTKLGRMKFISHLDTMRLFQRAITRANIPILYSQGFHPHPLMVLGNPLPLGIESASEFMELELLEDFPVEEFLPRLNAVLPKGIAITHVIDEVPDMAIQRQIDTAEYSFSWEGTVEDKEVARFMDAEEVIILRKRKKKGKKVLVEENIRPFVYNLRIDETQPGKIVARLGAREENHLRPDIFLSAFLKTIEKDIDPELVAVRRERNFDEKGRHYRGK